MSTVGRVVRDAFSGDNRAAPSTEEQLAELRRTLLLEIIADLLERPGTAEDPQPAATVRGHQGVDAGSLVPDEVVIGIVRERLQAADCQTGFILDGFPRTVAQADALQSSLAGLGRQLDRVLSLTVDAEALVQRLTGRRSCPKCSKVFNVYSSPSPLGDRCDNHAGGQAPQLVQRADDREDVIENRLKVYESQTRPLVEHYRGRGLLKVVNADQAVDRVYAEFLRAAGA